VIGLQEKSTEINRKKNTPQKNTQEGPKEDTPNCGGKRKGRVLPKPAMGCRGGGKQKKRKENNRRQRWWGSGGYGTEHGSDSVS